MLCRFLLSLGFFLAALEHAKIVLKVLSVAALICKAKIPFFVLDSF